VERESIKEMVEAEEEMVQVQEAAAAPA